MENKSKSSLLKGGNTLNGIRHLKVVDRWPATPKRVHHSALVTFSQKGIKMDLSKYNMQWCHAVYPAWFQFE